MGMVDTLLNSTMKVITAVLGFGILIAGGELASSGSRNLGAGVILLAIIVMVFSSKL